MEKNEDTGIKYCTIGNALTASRLVLLPFAIGGIAGHLPYLTAAAVGLALITDMLDGRISRLLKQASQFGANLDSTVDFVFLHLLLVAFFAGGQMTVVQFALIYAAMLATLALQFGRKGTDAEKVGLTRFSKPTGAFEYLFLLLLTARALLPDTIAVTIVGLVIFAFLAVFAILHIYQAVVGVATKSG